MSVTQIVGFLVCFVAGSCQYICAMEADVLTKPATMSSQEIIEKLITIEQLSREKRKATLGSDDDSDNSSLEDEPSWDELKADYAKYESKLALVPRLLRFEIHGDLDYLMTFDEIKAAVKKKLISMYKNGQMLTEDQFKKLNRNSWLCRGETLSRIWGAEYLAKKFKEHNQHIMKVSQHIIVVKRLDAITLSLFTGNCWPSLVEVINGKIYAQKIRGHDATDTIEVGYGFTDYSGFGNIRKTAEGDYYVLDTEAKSFYEGYASHYYVLKMFKKQKLNQFGFHSYIVKRFCLLNNIAFFQKYFLDISVLD